jgi:asparagine synthase (glutamine-hydrolysing)
VGIKRLLPGETIVVSAARIIERRRLPALPLGSPRDITDSAAALELDRVLEDSVANHQQSDVPYGMFLSGGIDSTALLWMMGRLNDRPVRAYTAGFAGGDVADERALARRVAEALRAERVEIEVTEADFWRDLPAIAEAMDDPAADYAVVPTWALARRAKGEVKVILSGEGGDELFAGYGRYRAVGRPWWLGGRRVRPRAALEGLGVLREEPRAWRDGIAAAESLAEGGGRTRLQVAQALDCTDWLPHDLMLKLDRCLMAHGIEGRTPFLDPVVAEFAFLLPDRLKIRRGRGKWLLRHWLAERVPIAEPFAAKRGFTVPVGAWIAGRAGELAPLLARQPGIEALCRRGAVENLFHSRGKRESFAQWLLLFYALWHRRHILGLAPAGDVFSTLASPA